MLRILLFPFAVLYDLVTRIRNYAYDRDIKPATRFDIPVISVGNLAVGGTGKTPMIEHLIRLLHSQHDVSTLSRGYGRNTHGFRIAKADDNAKTIGDEPYQLYLKFGDKITVAVGEDRALAIPNILQAKEDGNHIVLMDDAFQHRRVVPTFSLILTDYHRPFYKDYLLPAGRLRESASGARRADAVVVTKCPSELSEDTMMEMEHEIRRYSDKPVFFTKIRYGDPVAFGGHNKSQGSEVILVTGIANPTPLRNYLQLRYRIVAELDKPDHYAYGAEDLETLQSLASKHADAMIITTEKDMVKLDRPEFRPRTQGLPLFYLPIEVEFVKSGEDFDAMILNAVRIDG